MKDSQNLRILRHLAKGKTLTTMQAITKFGCTRLAARVAELRKSWPIETKWQSRNGKRWAVYSLVPRYPQGH
jgi:hypothetical protein